jgi:hypothetical protein
MSFTLGNFNIDEVLYAIGETFDGDLLYSLDQLSSASVEITSDSTDITDKKGNVVRTIYKTKAGTFTATNAFLHPQIMNAASGSDIEYASSDKKIVMPKIQILAAGASIDLDDSTDDDSVSVIGLYGSGANSSALKKGTNASFENLTFGYDASTNKITVPASGTDAPIKYIVKYDREITSGMKLSNIADVFPDTVKLTLYCSYVDPCDDNLKPVYVVLPSFQASPETTISLNADEQEMDFTGNLQIDYCASQPALYYLYFPDEGITKVVTGA